MGECNEQAVRQALDSINDPCMAAVGLDLSVNELGLINAIEVDGGSISVRITFTEVGCPFAVGLLDQIERRLKSTFANAQVIVKPDWNPPWSPRRMSPEARALLRSNAAALRRLMPDAAAREQLIDSTAQ